MSYTCIECGKKFETHCALGGHVNLAHKHPEIIEKAIKKAKDKKVVEKRSKKLREITASDEWSSKEIEVLKRFYPRISADVSNLLNRSRSAVVAKASRLGIRVEYCKYCNKHFGSPGRVSGHISAVHKPHKGTFRKGHTPWNKNLKGIHLSPETEFTSKRAKKIANRTWKDPEIRTKRLKPEKQKKTIVNCDYCGKEIERFPYDLEKSDHHFCSHECHNKWRRGKEPWNKGKKFTHSNDCRCPYCRVKRGELNTPYSLEFYEMKGEIRKRDNHTCQLCGANGEELGYTLEVHHIDRDGENNEPANLTSLCRGCHHKIHSEVMKTLRS